MSGQSLDLGPIISLRVSVFSPSGASGQELWSGQKVAEPRVKPGRRRGKKKPYRTILVHCCQNYFDYVAFTTVYEEKLYMNQLL